jgi:hypothetical protein
VELWKINLEGRRGNREGDIQSFIPLKAILGVIFNF